MRRGKKITALATILSLGVSGALISQPAASSVQDMSPNSTLGWVLQEVMGASISWVSIGLVTSRNGARTLVGYCTEIGPGKRSFTGAGPSALPSVSCDPADYKGTIEIAYQSLMAPVCAGQNRNCISRVFAIGPSGQKVQGQFVGYITPASFHIPANRTIGNPYAASSSIWKFPGVQNSLGSDLYEVQLDMADGWAEFKNGKLTTPFNLEDRTFSAQIRPVANEKGEGGSQAADLPDDYAFELSAILPRSMTSWYAGRVSSPEVTYRKIDGTYNEITIKGKPITIPTFAPSITKSQATPQILELFDFCQVGSTNCVGWHTQGTGWKRNFIEPFRPLMKDTASGSKTVWAMRSVYPIFDSKPTPGFFPCASRDRPAGISTTNAMVFTGQIPQYKGGFFSYDVSGLHFEPDGTTPFLGTYEMAMDEQHARCMFGFPRTPMSATVNVINRDGSKAIATTMVGTKNGQLRLSAYNFTFSKKTIQVQLKAKGHATCVRGDTVRFVKGTRCPGGFKRAP
jgi:hypothetical protein